MSSLFESLEHLGSGESDVLSMNDLKSDLMDVKKDVLFGNKSVFTLNSLQKEMGELDAINNTLTNSTEKYIPESVVRVLNKNLTRLKERHGLDLDEQIKVFAVENFSPKTLSYHKSKAIGLEQLNLARLLTKENILKVIEIVIRWLKKAWQGLITFMNKYSRVLDSFETKWKNTLNVEILKKDFNSVEIASVFNPINDVVDKEAVTATIRGEQGLIKHTGEHIDKIINIYTDVFNIIFSGNLPSQDHLYDETDMAFIVEEFQSFIGDLYVGPGQRPVRAKTTVRSTALVLTNGVETGSNNAANVTCKSLGKKDMLDVIAEMKKYYKGALAVGFSFEKKINDLENENKKAIKYFETRLNTSVEGYDVFSNIPDTLAYFQFLTSLIASNSTKLAEAFEHYNNKSIQDYILED